MAQSGGGQVVGQYRLVLRRLSLSQQGWNFMPTARNARGVDLLAYDVDIEEFAQELAHITRRFLKTKVWEKTEGIALRAP